MAVSGILSGGLGALQLLLLLLLQELAIGHQDLEVIQSPDSVLVASGETVTLNCVLVGTNLKGRIRWYKGKEKDQKLIYAENMESSSRALRVFPRSKEDFSIKISNIQPEDAGVYYCIAFVTFLQIKVASGKGTEVIVIARPGQPSLRGPTERMVVGSVAVFNCTTEGFSPREITVIWSKDGSRIQGAQTKVLPEGQQSTSYHLESIMKVPLARGDVASRLTCQIEHSTLETPLRREFPLANILRVPPKVRIDSHPPSPVQLNATVTVTCHVEEFYPDDAKVELFTKTPPSIEGTVDFRTLNSDGTSSLKSYLEVTATEERNLSHFTCFVKHNAKPHFKKKMILFIMTQLGESPMQYTILGLGIGLFLNKLGTVLLLLFLFRKKER